MLLWEKMDYEQKRLYELMAEVSEITWRAGWLDNLEYILWDACYCDDRYKLKESLPDHIKQIRRLAAEVGGWCIYHDEHEECFINNDEWAKIRIENYLEEKGPTHGQST